ncbi:MAG: DUF1934 domain-containing protein [Oscillospiraceae bacterium]|nr:DUF1934 domain-containing protein [Oscillospiraceae bacterium]
MKKERVIKITDMQSTANGDDGIEITTMGHFIGNENDYTLSFDENLGDGLKSSTLISVKGQKTASITRTGDICTEITVEPGKRHSCRYSTPYGDMLIGVYAQNVFSSVSRKGGLLEMNYTIDCNGSLIAKKQMIIKVSDALH